MIPGIVPDRAPVAFATLDAKPGACSIRTRDLVQNTATLPRYTARAHGDHNPKHGGIFFMAPHIEPRDLFLIYVPEDRLPIAAPLAVELTKRRVSRPPLPASERIQILRDPAGASTVIDLAGWASRLRLSKS